MITLQRFFMLLILGCPLMSGCGEPKVKGLVPVRGTVTYNGEVLDGAAVCFTPKEFKTGDRLGTGKTDARGRFEIRTIGELGILPGEYVIVVVKNEIISGEPKVDSNTGREIPVRPPPQEVRSLIPNRYNDPTTSGLHIVIGTKGSKSLHLELVD